MDPLLSVLQSRFALSSFRPGQRELISAILEGRDVLGILPTGGGKSLCYQLPALLLPGLTLVISPLISLMEDQVAACRRRGIPAAALTSAQTEAARRHILHEARTGRLRLLYIAPERLLSHAFLDAAAGLSISLIAIDEAHCISSWGRDFRPSYLEIARFASARPVRPVIAALTATAAPDVRRDILELAGLRRPFCLTTGFDRPNLYYEVRRVRDKRAALPRLLRGYPGLSGIVYCSTRRTVEAVTRLLAEHRIPAVRYHAGLSDEERNRNQRAWLSGAAPVIAATSAFGMGIDKPDVRFVIHYNMPADPEAYYQEAGRAGRDGLPADCILLYSPRDVKTARFFLAHSARERRAALDARLTAMRLYCTGRLCLRASLLRYFGEHASPFCGKCSVCLERGPFPPSIPEGTADPALLRLLVAVRKELADRTGRLPYKILSDGQLRALASSRPKTLMQMACIEGIGFLKTIKYGADFVNEIRTAGYD